MTRRSRLGACGESIAERFLTASGYAVLARNWRSGRREIDIVALRAEVVVFVEVKTRTPGVEAPVQALARDQRRRLRRAAEAWIHANPGVGREFRFDLIGIELHPGAAPLIRHIPDAFFGDEV